MKIVRKGATMIRAEPDRKRPFQFVLCLLVCNTLLLAFAGDLSVEWKKSTPLPESRTGYAAGLIDGRLVINGGTFWTGSKDHWIQKYFSSSTHAFDPVTEKWERLPDSPVTLGCVASTVVGNKLFVLGGYTGTAVNRKIYTLEKSKGRYLWQQFGELKVDRVFSQAVTVSNAIYLVGGTTEFEPTDEKGTCCTSRTATDSFMVLDTLHPDKGWRQLAPLPGPRRWFFSAETDGRYVWVFGGMFQAQAKDPIQNYADVFRYDTEEAKWEKMKPLPELSKDGNPPSPVKVHDKIVLVSDFKKVWQLDLKGISYGPVALLPDPVYVDKLVFVNGKIVGAGGEDTLQGPRRRSDLVFIGRTSLP